MKRVIIVHGWEGSPKEGWFPWLKKELEFRGFKVEVPEMPNSDEPNIKAWVDYLNKVAGEVDEKTYFVGHSMGCQTIMRYIEEMPKYEHIGGAVFVAGWFNLKGLQTNLEKEIAKPWLETEINFDKVRKHTHKFVEIMSDNDEYVSLTDAELFERKLNAKVIIERNMGHFSGEDGVKELPVVLNKLLEISK